jgi:hypothetical protein
LLLEWAQPSGAGHQVMRSRDKCGQLLGTPPENL